MTGVEILAIEEVITKYEMSLATKIVLIVIMCIAISGGIYTSVSSTGNFSDFIFCLVIGLIACLFIGGLVHDETKKPLEYETQYKVTISDDVKLNEFYNKYEIIEQEGKIFNVRDRKAD